MNAGDSITPEGLAALKRELSELEAAGRDDMSARINDARSLGDLKENADYHIAKDDQAHLETKIKRLRLRLRDAVIVEPDASSATFDFGRTAAVTDEASRPDARVDHRRGDRGRPQVGQALGGVSRREALMGGEPATPSRSKPRAESGLTASNASSEA